MRATTAFFCLWFSIAVAFPGRQTFLGFSATSHSEVQAPAPEVTIPLGTVVGNSQANVDSFLGIPYAQAPTGTKRLTPPTPLSTGFGTLTATSLPTACPQFLKPSSDIFSGLPSDVVDELEQLFQPPSPTGEDCLNLNVQRPSGTNSSSKLPVLFWIYGGGFEFGDTESYNATKIVEKSVILGTPILFVAVSYRVAGFGFLPGREVQEAGASNLGLRDQRLALEWVADNIAAFGGDPARVTLWGESAGGISVYDHLFINDGDNNYKGKPLFIGAMMDSGTLIPSLDIASPTAQKIYDTVVTRSGCHCASDTLGCLRALSYDDYLNASNSLPSEFSYRSLDAVYFPRPDHHSSFFRNEYPERGVPIVGVPVVIGDQEDEGTLFSLPPKNVTTTEALVDYLASYFPLLTRAKIRELVDTYPSRPSAGSPFRTGDRNELYPQFKRNAAIVGDMFFTLVRRWVLNKFRAHRPDIPTWSYLSSYRYGTPFLGTFHASDILESYDDTPYPEPADTIVTHLVSFVNYQDPNTIPPSAPSIYWPEWTPLDPVLMNFLNTSNQLILDDFRTKSYKVLEKLLPRLKI